MTLTTPETISVSLIFDSTKSKAIPKSLIWKNRLYPITKVGFHHVYKTGETLFHVFSVTTPNLFFRLILNTENLQWHVTDISDKYCAG